MQANERLEQLNRTIQPHRDALLKHPLYEAIDDAATLQTFMEHHVFAVWDFMSLLMRLREQVCGAGSAWLPPADPQAARFVNEIVLGEETDERPSGGYASHYDLYLTAMLACGADTAPIDGFLGRLRSGQNVADALRAGGIPASVVAFVKATFDLVENGAPHEVASAFTFGREDLLPDVFRQIVARLNSVGGGLDDMEYYLGRHIELDGDHHGPMAERLVISLCGDSPTKWQEAQRAAVQTLQARLALWDGICQQITARQPA